MAEKTIIGKRKEAYRSAEKKFKRDQELKNAFTALNAAIPARKSKTAMTPEQMNKLRDEYKKVISVLSERMKVLMDKKNGDPTVLAKPISKEAKDKLKVEYDYMAKIRKTMSKDLKYVDYCIKDKKYPTVSQLYENSRSEQATVDLANAKKYGQGMSSRYGITIPGPDEKPVEGFFTISRKGKNYNDRQEELKHQMIDKYGDAAQDFFKEDAMTMINVLMCSVNYAKMGIFEKSKLLIRGLETVDLSLERLNMKETIRKLSKDKKYRKVLDRDTVSKSMKAVDTYLKTPEKYKIFVECFHGIAKLRNSMDINEELGINNLSKVDKRNSATSMVAEMLGCSKVIVKSKNLHVKDPKTGKITMGTFMEKAEGVDFISTNPEDMEKFSNLTPDKVEGNIHLIKDIANIQINDWICGNADRHMGNMFYKFDEAGRLAGVVGIDNDASFGKKNHGTALNGIELNNLGIIPKDTYDRLCKMNAEELKVMLYGYDLSSAEVNKAVERLNKLKNKIETDKEYFKDKPMGYVEEGRIKVVTEDEMGMLSIVGELGKAVPVKDLENKSKKPAYKNLFGMVREMSTQGYGAWKCIHDLRKDVYDSISEVNEIGNENLGDLVKKMDESQRKTHKPSELFMTVRNALNDCSRFVKMTSSILVNIDKNEFFKVNDINLNQLRDKLETAATTCDTYLEGKNKAEIDRKSKTSNAYIRYNLVDESKKNIQKILSALDKIVDKSQRMIEKDEKRREMRDISAKEEINIYSAVHEKNMRLANNEIKVAAARENPQNNAQNGKVNDVKNKQTGTKSFKKIK
ncbi:hypothetical protein SAMN04487934_11357 [Eubacterium ruminantium]|nr:hypothetical protein SAMN04487934_11357 [Eubacterium ruminantium]